jgi:hypothetical protein
VFGKQDSAAIDLSVIVAGKNTIGFVIKGESRHDYSGYSVSSAGDVNGDGLDDLIIGANSANPSGLSSANSPLITKPPVPTAIADNSMALVLCKKDNTSVIELSAIAAGTGGFVIKGESANDYSGYSG